MPSQTSSDVAHWEGTTPGSVSPLNSSAIEPVRPPSSPSDDNTVRQMDVAEAVCAAYGALGPNGKPQGATEFTVLAGIVARTGASRDAQLVVVALATGTRSAGSDSVDPHGRVLKDSHAEVLARRGLVAHVLQCARALRQDAALATHPCCIMESDPSGRRPFRLKPGYSLHLFISDSPCGDACIYKQRDGEVAFTGAKLLHRDGTDIAVGSNLFQQLPSKDAIYIREREDQLVGFARSKPGRSDIACRSLSMSCSDKVARWSALGLQGKLLAPWVSRLPLTSVVVGEDPAGAAGAQLAALQRAAVDRLAPLPVATMEISVVPAGGLFMHCKSFVKARVAEATTAVETAKATAGPETAAAATEEAPGEVVSRKRRRKEASPCSTSLNWVLDLAKVTRLVPNGAGPPNWAKLGSVEVTVGNDGTLQGSTKKPRKDPDAADVCLPCSRLSRASLRQLVELLRAPDDVEVSIPLSYDAWKDVWTRREVEDEVLHEEARFFEHSAFMPWIRSAERRLTLSQAPDPKLALTSASASAPAPALAPALAPSAPAAVG